MDQRERERRAELARDIAKRLSAENVVAVAINWMDICGLTRVKAVPLSRLEHAAAWGLGASPVFDVNLVDDSLVMGRFAGGPVGDLRLHPDLSRLTVLGAQPGWAWAPADRYDQGGEVHFADSRSLVRRLVDQLSKRDLSVRLAFEIEWWVSVGDGDEFVPAGPGPSYGMTRLVALSGYVRDLLVALASQGVAVEQIHPEGAVGQLELSVAAEDPVNAADTVILVCETIRAVSREHGLRVSFAPMALAGKETNGRHAHVSLWRDGVNVMAGGDRRYGLTPLGEAFAGGILSRLPALLAVGAPTVASYLRLIPSHWAGAFACWGLENREAALRFVTGETGRREAAANFEVKCFDGAANPYLVVAGLLAAGMAGIAESATLPEPVEVDPASLDEDERRARGIAALPSSLAESVKAFESDAALGEAFGEKLVDTVATVRRGEIVAFEGLTEQEIVERTRWRF